MAKRKHCSQRRRIFGKLRLSINIGESIHAIRHHPHFAEYKICAYVGSMHCRMACERFHCFSTLCRAIWPPNQHRWHSGTLLINIWRAMKKNDSQRYDMVCVVALHFVLRARRPIYLLFLLLFLSLVPNDFAVYTEQGKVRALIRSALNERALERYILTWLSDANGLAQRYESWALVRDNEAANLLPSIAAGKVKSIIKLFLSHCRGFISTNIFRLRIDSIRCDRRQFRIECGRTRRNETIAKTKWNYHCRTGCWSM